MTRERDEWASGVLREQGFCGSITAPGYVCIRAPHDHGEESMTPLDALTEALAELEHLQWMEWAKAVQHEVSRERLDRWDRYFTAYANLDEEAKEHDRKWARAILAHPAMADLARKAEALDRLESLDRIVAITGPHPKGATSKWLVRDGRFLIEQHTLSDIAAALEGDK